jgi:hypothetical protein
VVSLGIFLKELAVGKGHQVGVNKELVNAETQANIGMIALESHSYSVSDDRSRRIRVGLSQVRSTTPLV